MTTNRNDQAQWEPTWTDYVVSIAGGLCFLGQIALCIFAYKHLGQTRVLYLGWTVLAFALYMGMSSRRTFEKHPGASDAASGRETAAIVDSGWYGIVRHPIYLSFTMVIFSLMLISQHWLNVILGLPWMAFLFLSMISEERSNATRFGDAYRRYMQEVPRVNFILGAIRYWQRRRANR